MSIAAQQLQSLAAADALHASASERFDRAVESAREAAHAEGAVALDRLNTYQSVLGSGFIIEQVLEPSAVSYMAGYSSHTDGQGLFGGWEYEEEWLILDGRHANRLAGTVIERAGFQLNQQPRVNNLKEKIPPHSLITVEFVVPGTYWRVQNRQRPKALFRSSPDHETPTGNHYKAPLNALEWRLRTPDDTALFSRI